MWPGASKGVRGQGAGGAMLGGAPVHHVCLALAVACRMTLGGCYQI